MKYSKIVLLGVLLQLLFSADCLAQNLEPSAEAEDKQDSQEKKIGPDTDESDTGTDSIDSVVEENSEENVAEASPPPKETSVEETPAPFTAAVTNEEVDSAEQEELPGPVVLEKTAKKTQPAEELPGPVTVEDEPLDDILSLTLEQLLDITVVSASKKYEKSSEAPATMTVWTRQDMDNLGYHNIYELADITPGFSSYYIYGERALETRGRKAGSFENNKHLVMVDGIPVNHARGMKAPIEEDLPLYFADQVEFLTGPASALYGVSAYFGVINVTSQNTVDNGGAARGRISFGGPDFHRSVMGNTYYKNDSGTFKLALSYYEKDASGMQLGIEDEEYGLTYTGGYKNRLWDDKTALFLYASYRIDDSFLKGFEVGNINMLRTTGLGEHWMWGEYSPEANELQWGTFIPYVKYNHDFNDQIKLQSYVLYNRSTEKGSWAVLNRTLEENYDGTADTTTTPYSVYNIPVNNIQGQIEMHYENNPFIDAIIGLNVDYKQQAKNSDGNYSYSISSQPPEPIINTTSRTKDKFYTVSAYLQLQKDFPVLEGLILTAGLRNDNGIAGENTYNAFSPRGAIVQKFTDWLNLKLMYGAAIRAPGIKEAGLNLEALRNEEKNGLTLADIKPEKIQTLEAGLVFPTKYILASATYFHNITTNPLNGDSVILQEGTSNEHSVNFFKNGSGKSRGDGFELALTGNFKFGLRPFVNVAFAKTRLYIKGESFTDRVPDVPTTKVNAGLNYRSPINLYASVAGKYIYDWRAPRNVDADGNYVGWQPKPDGYFVLDGLLGYDITKAVGVQFQVKNITGSNGKYPKGGRLMLESENDNRGMQDVPIPPRTFFGTLTVQI